MDAVQAAEEYRAVIRSIPVSWANDKTLLRQMIEGAVYIRQCLDDKRTVDMKTVYPWPLARFYPHWRAIYESG